MMTREQALQVQSWVDGELPPSQVGKVAAWVEQDPEARAIAEELRAARRVLVECAPEHRVPDTREFYWSQIARGIALAEAPAQSRRAPFAWPIWTRWLAPAGALAAVAVAMLLWTGVFSGSRPQPVYLATGDEIETPLEDVASFTFRSESECMTVIWVDFPIN